MLQVIWFLIGGTHSFNLWMPQNPIALYGRCVQRWKRVILTSERIPSIQYGWGIPRVLNSSPSTYCRAGNSQTFHVPINSTVGLIGSTGVTIWYSKHLRCRLLLVVSVFSHRIDHNKSIVSYLDSLYTLHRFGCCTYKSTYSSSLP